MICEYVQKNPFRVKQLKFYGIRFGKTMRQSLANVLNNEKHYLNKHFLQISALKPRNRSKSCQLFGVDLSQRVTLFSNGTK